MSIISTIGRRHWKVRALTWTITLLLVVGSVTMIYPFLLMVAGSTKSAVDMSDTDLIPAFLRNDTALYRKHIEALFNESLQMMKSSYDSDAPAFYALDPPDPPAERFAAEWARFLESADLPHYTFTSGSTLAPVTRGVFPLGLRLFQEEMVERFDGDVEEMNRQLGTEFLTWSDLRLAAEDYLVRRGKPGTEPFNLAYQDFKMRQPPASRIYFSPEGFYRNGYLKTQYGKDIAGYNKSHGTAYTDWGQVHLTRNYPAGPAFSDEEREDWEVFVRTLLSLFWIRAETRAAPAYQGFLKAKYRTIEGLNRNYGTGYGSFEAVPLIEEVRTGGLAFSDWDAFLQGWKDPETGEEFKLPPGMIRLHTIDFMFRDYLKAAHGTCRAMNAALGTAVSDWMEVFPPQQDLQYLDFKERKGEIRREFIRRNYVTVIDYMVLHGRGILNTAIYCALQILCALTINPLAAYGLSRYKPPSAYKILLFLMLTMAFPPMVTQIPAFLMLREFNLLNTFWALILPGMANGYSIFLLKGFFDSLPQELYESAELDGAGEFRIFFQITMSLSTPILAVVALRAFTMAYSNFMMALLICQDQKMWTLMPWLYQLQQRCGPGITYASLLIAAIPTFLVFAFCQNVIMRGIVVPVEK